MFTHISNQTTMNPTGDALTAELQNTTHIEQPVVVGQGEKTTMTEKVEKVGEKIGEKFGETLHGVEQTVHKAAEVVAEETAKVELPGVVTLFTSGAAKLFGHLSGAATTETTSLPTRSAVTTPLSPVVLKSDIKEIIVTAEKNLSGDTITTEVQRGHFTVETAPSRIDVLKESGQLGHPTELHFPNLHIPNMPLNRAVEEPIHKETEQKPTTEVVHTQPAPHWASFVTRAVEEPIHKETEQKTTTEVVHTQPARHWASFVTIHDTPAEQKTEMFEQQSSGLTTPAIHDGVVFLDKIEQLDNLQSHKTQDVVNESEQTQLTLKVVHDGAAFMDQAEQQKNTTSQQAKGTVNQPTDLPSLTTKDVQNGAQFINVVENQVI